MAISIQKKKALQRIDPYLSEPVVEESNVVCKYIGGDYYDEKSLYQGRTIYNRTPTFLRDEEVYVTKNTSGYEYFFSIRRKGFKSVFMARIIYLKDAKIKLVPRKDLAKGKQNIKLVFSGKVIAPKRLISPPEFLGFHKPTNRLVSMPTTKTLDFACSDCIEKLHQALDTPLDLVLTPHNIFVVPKV